MSMLRQKLHWLKANDCTPVKTVLTDKYSVKDWVSRTIDTQIHEHPDKLSCLGSQCKGSRFVIPVLGVWQNADNIDFESLPDQFVLKANHGWRYNIIVSDKSLLNVDNVREQLNKWLAIDYSLREKELQYKDIPRLIFAEKFVIGLTDCHFYCVNGVPKYCSIVKLYGVEESAAMNVYNMNRELQPFTMGECPNINNGDEPPVNFDLLKTVAEWLCKDFKFVRVDLYASGDKVYFGEMTFTPYAMNMCIRPEEYEDVFSSIITPDIVPLKNFVRDSVAIKRRTSLETWCDYWKNINNKSAGQAVELGINGQWDSWFEGDIKERCRQWTADNVQRLTIPAMWVDTEQRQNQFDFGCVDDSIRYADELGLKKYYHCLSWDHYSWFKPRWINSGIDHNEYMDLWKKWIDEIGTRFDARIDEWEVINEATSKGDGHIGKRIIVGDGFYKTMKYANDNLHGKQGVNFSIEILYNLSVKGKDAPEYKIVDNLLSRGIRLDFVGTQWHAFDSQWSDRSFSPERLHRSLNLLSDFGVPIYITEFSVNLYETNPDFREIQAMLTSRMINFLKSFKMVRSITYWLERGKNVYYNNRVGDLTDEEFRPYPALAALVSGIRK